MMQSTNQSTHCHNNLLKYSRDRIICNNDGFKYLYTQAVPLHRFSLPIRMSLMNSPKVARAIVRASVMILFHLQGL